jgi:hypothetical protein
MLQAQGASRDAIGHSLEMAQMPDPESSARGETPAPSGSDAAAWLASAIRGCARGGAGLLHFAASVDSAMGRMLVARDLRTHSKSQSLSLIGSGAILIAAFAPLMNVPVVGAVTYFNGDSQIAIATGLAIIVLGVASLICALIEKYSWLYGIGFSSMLIALGTIVSWKWYLARASNSPSPPANGILDYFTQSASKGLAGHSSLSFGLPLLIYGAVLVMLAALLRPREVVPLNSELQPH